MEKEIPQNQDSHGEKACLRDIHDLREQVTVLNPRSNLSLSRVVCKLARVVDKRRAGRSLN